MSVPVSLEGLRDEVARFGDHAYVLTVGRDGRPHAVMAPIAWADEQLAAGVGKTTAANAAARPEITILWPPVEPQGYSLIVDGAAEVDGGEVRVAPTKAILHRRAPGGPAPDGRLSDCVTLLKA